MIIKRRPAHIADSAYMTRDDRDSREYFHSRKAACCFAKANSSVCDIVVYSRCGGLEWESIRLFRGGKVYCFGRFRL